MEPRVTRAWYVACESRELKSGPLARSLFGTPLVLFRDGEGRAGALLDRCAHRGVPLSIGRVVDGRLRCGYHGWEYDPGGSCVRIPGLCGEAPHRTRIVPSHPAREQDGYVWVWGEPEEPRGEPFRVPDFGKGYTTVRRVVEAAASLTATLENALDVPHTAFLHRGLFRGAGKTNLITARVTRTPEGLQAEYVGEPRPEGLAAKILSPSGGTVTHFDRFLLPSIAQVEYRLGEENHFVVTSLATPVEEHRTRMHAHVTFRTRFPGWIVKLVLLPVAMRIFRQDAEILRVQTESARRWGDRYVSTEIDVLGLQIARLLRLAEKGQLGTDGDDASWRREIRMEV
jgi:phenylpropionate dioxygenase-like ring-hydroxylating dioxygenase large terminal subunit